MKRKDIEKIFSDVVLDYMNNGYHINMNTMSGTQGEIAKVDLTNGKEVIRIMLDSDYSWNDDVCCSFNSIVLTVGRNTNKLCDDRHDIIWNHDLDIINQTIYYQIGKNEKYFGTKDDAINAKEKHRARVATWGKNYYNTIKIYNDDKVKAIVLPFIKRQYKCKSATIKDIESVEKKYDSITKKPYYSIKARGRYYVMGNRG